MTIDYPKRKVHFAPYTDTSFILDPGATYQASLLAANGSNYSVGVDLLGDGRPHAKGVNVGDGAVVAIDGQLLASLTVLSGRRAGRRTGRPRLNCRSVQFGAAVTLTDKTVSFTMTDLLPLPQ